MSVASAARAAITAEVVTLPDLCTGFPSLPDPLIDRPTFLSTLNDMFDGPAQIVVIEGSEGIGKTTLAAQYARQQATRAFSLFVSDLNSLTRSSEYALMVLCDQIHWYFNGSRLPEGVNPETYIRTARLQLARQASEAQVPFLFVIDGLLQMADADPALLSLVLTDYLPTGIEGFKFLFTGDSAKLPNRIKEKVAYKYWTPPGFGPEEAKLLLAQFHLSGSTIVDLVNTFSGSPGKLASVGRILASGVPPSLLESDLPKTLSGLFDIEWRSVRADDPLQLRLLGLITHAKHALKAADLAAIMGTSDTNVLEHLTGLSFIRTGQDGAVTFVSASFQAFTATKLAFLKTESLNMIVDRLTALGVTAETIEHLPTYFSLLGRHSDLIPYLGTEHLTTVCERLRSLRPVATALQKGMKAAETLDSPADMFSFAFRMGLISDLESASVFTREVEARLALGEEATALALAQGALLKEDRLEALAAIVSAQVERGSKPDSAILGEVRTLARDVTYSASPERALSIASDLIATLPEVAIHLVESATTDSSAMPIDVALATLSLAAKDLARDQVDIGSSVEAISSRIKNPSIREMAATLSLMIGDYSIDDLLTRCDKLESVRDRIYLLERWASKNPERKQAHKVIEYAMGLLIRTSEHTPNATTVRRLAAPLPYLSTEQPYETNTLLQTIDAQLAMLQKNGPSIDYTRLCCTLAEAEATWNPDQALSRFESLCYFVAELEVDLRLEALSWILATLRQDLHQRLSNVRLTLLETIESEFRTASERLLSETAEHYEALKRVVRALAGPAPQLLLEVIAKVNTQARRDTLCATAIREFGRLGPAKVKPDTVRDFLAKIDEPITRDRALSNFLAGLDSKTFSTLDPSWADIVTYSLGIGRAPVRAICCAHSLAISARNKDVAEFRAEMQKLAERLHSSIEQIDSDWDRTDLGLSVATVISDAESTAARELLTRSHEGRQRSTMPDGRTAHSYILSARLAIRAYTGLIPRKLDLETSFERLKRLINHVPSFGERIRLWADLATRCFGSEHSDIGKKVVEEQISPIINSIADRGFRTFILVQAAAALYCANPLTAIRQLDGLDEHARSEAFENVARFYLSQQPQEEPVDGPSRPLRSGDIDNILECLGHIDNDTDFAGIVEQLCRAISTQEFSKYEKADFARRISDVAARKLPWAKGICHQGYSIVVRAILLRLSQASEDGIRKLRDETNGIDNIADRALVLCVIAENAPPKFAELRTELTETARALAQAIPAPLDRMERLRSVADTAREFNTELARSCLQDAFLISLKTERDLTSQQRKMIDLAYRIGEDFAKSLISQMEDDPAITKRRQQRVREGAKINELIRKFPSGLREPDLEDLSEESLGDMSFRLLAGLHAGTITYCPPSQTYPMIRRAAAMTLENAYPTLAWSIQNSVAMHSRTPYGTTHLVNLFEACACACELAMHLMSRAAGYKQGASPAPSAEAPATHVFEIMAGEREKAISIIREWLTEVHPATLIVSDPYFSPKDLELVNMALQASPTCSIEIMTGEAKQRNLGLVPPYDSVYEEHWSRLSQHAPPETRIVIAGPESPVHERYIIADQDGLELGTSFGGLGGSKESKITKLPRSFVTQQRHRLQQYLVGRVRDQAGLKIRYYTIAL